jgi:sensor histidine kinase regulating citrate/malate metabolism
MMLVSTLLFSVFSLYIPNPEVLLQGSKMSIRVLIILIGKAVLFACYQLLSKLFSKEKSIININAMMMFGLTIGTAIGLAVLMKIASVIENVDADVEILILASILVLLNVIFYLLIWQNQKMQKHKYELRLIAERISNYEKHSDEVAIIWDNIKSVKHDLNNHFLYLQAQLELGNTEKCKTYLSEIQSEVSKMGKLFKTGNDVIDYMINVKMSRLTETQILVSGNAGEFADILDADMTCILGNILDNAIEALEKVKKNKRLELHFSSTKNCRIILCKNSVDESILNVNSELNTTKSDAEHHGFGHVIVEDIVQKYGGFTDYFEDDEMFGVQISIPMIIN